jgi:hypothetical protein
MRHTGYAGYAIRPQERVGQVAIYTRLLLPTVLAATYEQYTILLKIAIYLSNHPIKRQSIPMLV